MSQTIPASKIDAWLDANAQSGRQLVELHSPRGHLCFATSLDDKSPPSGESILQSARADAFGLAGKPEYVLMAKSAETSGFDRLPFRVEGGQRPDDLPDAVGITNGNQALGHVVRALVETNKQLVGAMHAYQELATSVAQSRDGEVHDLRVIATKWMRAEQRQGETAVAMKLLESERESEKRRTEALIAGAGSLKPLIAGLSVKLLGTGAAGGNAIDEVYGDLDETSSEKILELVGPKAAAALLRARGPKAVEIIYDALDSLPNEKLMAVLDAIPAAKRGVVVAALQAEVARRKTTTEPSRPKKPKRE